MQDILRLRGRGILARRGRGARCRLRVAGLVPAYEGTQLYSTSFCRTQLCSTPHCQIKGKCTRPPAALVTSRDSQHPRTQFLNELSWAKLILQSLRRAAGPLLGLFLVGFFLLLAFAHVGLLAFGTQVVCAISRPQPRELASAERKRKKEKERERKRKKEKERETAGELASAERLDCV